MENRIRPVAFAVVALLFAIGRPQLAAARPLDEQIPGLFGGVLVTSITPSAQADVQAPRVADRFRALSAALASSRSTLPPPSTTGAFSFVIDPEYEGFQRIPQSLGPTLAERALTLGAGTMTLGVAFTHTSFDSLEGSPLRDLYDSQPALDDEFLANLPERDRIRASDNTLATRLALSFTLGVVYLNAAYGLTDSIDVSASLAIVHAQMSATAEAQILDPNGDGGAFFTGAQQGVVIGGAGPVCGIDFRCARSAFASSAFGTGDFYLRGKWRFASTDLADFAALAVVTAPTGNSDDFLGFRDATLTPSLIASKTVGRISPHINLGYAVRSGHDGSQALWIAGIDVRTWDWLTMGADFLGYHDDHRDGINDNVLQTALGMKVNPWGTCVLGGSLQLPLNSDGLRADVIYTGQVEWTF